MTATLLLVDPEPTKCSHWAGLLGSQGFQVFTTLDERAAIDVCGRLQPDLVLLHESSGGRSSLETGLHIRSDPRNRMTPIVAVVSDDVPTDAMSADFGVDEVLPASISPSEELRRVRAMLNMKAFADQQAESVLKSLARSIESRDPYTQGHCERLSQYAVELGKSMGLLDEELHALSIAGIVHDIGKVSVPDAVLLKPGPLTDEELEVLRQHPVVGEHICAPLKSLRHVLPIIRHHHEHMDGSGYPDGLKKSQIHLTARILQTVDIYDALTTDRPYRRALSHSDAVHIMNTEADRGWIDGTLVRKFEETLSCRRFSSAL